MIDKKHIITVALVVLAGLIGGFVNAHLVPPQKLGSIASPDIMSPYFSYGGVIHWASKTTSPNAATTTPCAFQSPVSTSTLISASAQFSVGSTTNMVLTWAKASSPYATTTIIATSSVSANNQTTFLAASTTPVGDSTNGRAVITDRTFASSTYLVLGIADATAETTAGSFTPVGTCEATWVQN